MKRIEPRSEKSKEMENGQMATKKYMIVNEDSMAFAITLEDGQTCFNWVDPDAAWVRLLPQAQAEAEAVQLRNRGFVCRVVEADTAK